MHCTSEFQFTKTADKANHSRWCSSNPKLVEYKNNPNLTVAVRQSKDKKYGAKKDFCVTCAKCNKDFTVSERELQFPKKKKYFCSVKCGHSHEITKEQRRQISSTLTGLPYADPIAVTKNCIHCNKPFTYIKHYTKRDKEICSTACTKRANNKAKQVGQPTTIKSYRADCAFKFSLNDYPEEFNFTLIETYGWYKPKNKGDNLTGVSRDHAVSVRYGLDNNLPAAHLAHPANCVLMQHGKNVSKGTANSITYEELLNKISEWDKKYTPQST